MSNRTGRHHFNFETFVCEICGVSEAADEDNPRPCRGWRPQPNLGAPAEAKIGGSVASLGQSKCTSSP